jgi:cobalt-zinc-cadmium efflux system protein
MLEDVLGWAVVLAGAVVMKFTDLAVLDPLLSMGVAVFILVHSLGNLREVADLFLERTPRGVDMQALREHLSEVEGVASIRELAVRSLDGERHEATLHLGVSGDAAAVKVLVRAVLAEQGIDRATIETDRQKGYLRGVGHGIPLDPSKYRYLIDWGNSGRSKPLPYPGYTRV